MLSHLILPRFPKKSGTNQVISAAAYVATPRQYRGVQLLIPFSDRNNANFPQPTVRPELVEGLWVSDRWFDKLTTNGLDCWRFYREMELHREPSPRPYASLSPTEEKGESVSPWASHGKSQVQFSVGSCRPCPVHSYGVASSIPLLHYHPHQTVQPGSE